MVKSKSSRFSSLKTDSTSIDLQNTVDSSPSYKSIDWTWGKIISVCLLGSVAFYSTHQIAWDSIKPEHLVAQPNLNNNHYNNIINSEINSHLQKSRRSVEENQVHKLHESNSAMPGLDLTLFNPTEAIESHEIHKRAISLEDHEHNQEDNDVSKLQKFFYPDYEHIPLAKLETVQITNGKSSVTMYTQGTEEPPNKGMHERNFMITEGDYEHKQLLVNSPSLSDVKKFGQKPSRYYYGRDGLNQEDFLQALAQSGADEYEAYDQKDLEYYEEKAYEKQYGSKMPGRNSQGVRYVPAELPCLKEKEPLFSQWLKEQDAPNGFARAFPVDQASGFGGGKGGAPKDPSQKSGPPIGCCNGKPFSAKKRCCCRRKSYDTETEFCCVSPQGCAAFQTFTNTTENRNACMNIGGRIVLNEYFDYQATPMIGWASSRESARPYGPAYMQSAKSLDRELMIRYSDKVNNRGVDKSEKSEKKDEKEESAKTNKNKNDRNSNKNRPTEEGLNFEDFKMEELEEMTQELLNEMKAADIKYKSPNSAEAWRMDDLLSSRDHIDDLLSGENPFAWAGDSAV